MIYKLYAYRVPINASLLEQSAAQVLAESGDAESLRLALGWTADQLPFLEAGLKPDPGARRVGEVMRDQSARIKLRDARRARGFHDFISPRKGIKGWWQRRFCDPKELRLAIGFDLLEYLQRSTRYQLIVAVHDALLSMVSSAEPQRVADDDLEDVPHPLSLMLQARDMNAAGILQHALSGPFSSIPPAFLVDGVGGFIIQYDRTRGLACYYGQ